MLQHQRHKRLTAQLTRLHCAGLAVEIHPGSGFVKDVFVEKLQAITINFNRTPRMALHQGAEVVLRMLANPGIGRKTR